MDDILTTREVAKHLKISEEFVRQLIRKNIIRAYPEGRRGGYRILKEDIMKYVEGKFLN